MARGVNRNGLPVIAARPGPERPGRRPAPGPACPARTARAWPGGPARQRCCERRRNWLPGDAERCPVAKPGDAKEKKLPESEKWQKEKKTTGKLATGWRPAVGKRKADLAFVPVPTMPENNGNWPDDAMIMAENVRLNKLLIACGGNPGANGRSSPRHPVPG